MAVYDWLEWSGRLNRSLDDKPETGVQRGWLNQNGDGLLERGSTLNLSPSKEKVAESEWRNVTGKRCNTKSLSKQGCRLVEQKQCLRADIRISSPSIDGQVI